MIHPNFTYRAKVVSVYDGDTIRADVDLGFSLRMCNASFRLSGIDTPEIRGAEREEGIKVRDIVREMILGRDVIIETEKDKSGKYGRYLATIWIDGINVNKWLVEQGHAERYA